MTKSVNEFTAMRTTAVYSCVRILSEAIASLLKCFDGDIFKRFVERIIVYSRTEIGFELKCGLTLKERLVK